MQWLQTEKAGCMSFALPIIGASAHFREETAELSFGMLSISIRHSFFSLSMPQDFADHPCV